MTGLPAVDWSLMLDGPGRTVEGPDDVAQAVRIIITTPLRSDPHRPDFGCDLQPWIDLPVPVAAPGIIAAVRDALDRWEPRLSVLDVAVAPGAANAAGDGAGLMITVTWRLAGAPAGAFRTEVAIR
ncbi:GPW/gp25 family protein [Azospirillum halopraeferens]|uniref:GPW/gp25 family protein n=1 Tax=Azospirillum halopraeferens TaxID=34010 RepID=UPI00040F6987|nr:GPW/gp25 family protein [Azospirillum halopraeferens]